MHSRSLALSLHVPAANLRSPVRVVTDPIRGAPHVLVMCEVFAPNGQPHLTNTRAKLRDIIDDKVKAEECWYGFEQEYTMLKKGSGQIYGWPENGYPAPQVTRVSACTRCSA